MANDDLQFNKELNLLKDWADHVLDRVLPKEHPMHDQFKATIQGSFERRNLPALRTIAKEMREWAKDLRPADYDLLDKELIARFGKPLKASTISKVQKILANGKIKNRKEFETMLRFVEEHHDNDTMSPEIKNVNRLIAMFEQHRA